MAFSIAQLQAFSNTKPELRYVTEEIIDYLEANPGGGSGTVETIVAGSGIAVDATDPANPEVSASGGALGYLVYTALLSQSGVADPVATEFTNTLGDTVTWFRGGAGDYSIQCDNPIFTANKTTVLIGPPAVGVNVFYEITSLATTAIGIGSRSLDDLSATDGLNGTFIEIRIYP